MHSQPLFKLSVDQCTSKQFIYIAVRIYTGLLYNFNVPSFRFLKRPLHEILACFTWPIYTDFYCGSRSCLIFLKGVATLFSPFIEIHIVIFKLLLVSYDLQAIVLVEIQITFLTVLINFTCY
jgi:hypothetical protein